MLTAVRRLRVWQNDHAIAAVEFGLLAPMLVLGLVLMLDVGFAIGQRMELDRNVRAGVQATMSNINDLTAVRDVVLSTADAPDELTVTVNRTCSCAGAAAPCTTWCAGGEPPSVFVNISAVQDYEGVMLPPITLDSDTYVQLR